MTRAVPFHTRGRRRITDMPKPKRCPAAAAALAGPSFRLHTGDMMKTEITTLCYIEKDGCYLMLHRISKKHDLNKDKWIGVGGHVEDGESPEECLVREVMEETGLSLESFAFRGLVTFTQEGYGTEYMCLYTAVPCDGEIKECDEGVLTWVPLEQIPSLNLWEGDRIFLKLLENKEEPFFSLKLTYKGDTLTEVIKNGKLLNV